MPDLSPADVAHIAKLARLRLSPEEAKQMAKELSGILKYVDMLNEVNTDKVEPTAQVTGLTTVLRPDVIDPITSDPDALLD